MRRVVLIRRQAHLPTYGGDRDDSRLLQSDEMRLSDAMTRKGGRRISAIDR